MINIEMPARATIASVLIFIALIFICEAAFLLGLAKVACSPAQYEQGIAYSSIDSVVSR